MAEYIEREALLKRLDRVGAICGFGKYLIEIFPSADVAPVRHGKNLDAEWPSLFACSACGWSDADTTTGDIMFYNYCPNCGAKMDLEG